MENKLNIKLVEESRQEYEQNIPDFIRFQYPENYQTEAELQYFRDEHLRRLFVQVFWEQRDIHQAVEAAVRAYPCSKFRIEQVRDLLLGGFTSPE